MQGNPDGWRSIVLIPTYNEAESLPAVVAGVLAQSSADVLVIDDDSPDGTGQIADALSASDARVQVMHRAGRGGLAGAYRAGFAQALGAGYEVVGQIDADGSHDPAALPELFAALDGCDLVIGSRYVPGGSVENWPRLRHWISAGGCLYSRTLLGMPVRDTTSGFKLWRARMLSEIDVATTGSNGYVFQVETTLRALRAGACVREVPITFVEREAGASKFSPGIFVEAALRVVALVLRGQRFRG